MTQASICTIGDEILIGQIVDTNSSHISQALNALGVKVTRMLSISDAHDEIVNSLDRELAANDIVIVTGGLGPTKDDITKPALACLSGTTQYKTDERQLEIIHKILSSRGLDVLDINIAQASASGVTLENHTTEQFDLAMYSGLYATFYYMQACYPYLKETKGSVINFASGAGLFGNFGQSAYAAAKEGIRGMSRVAATEWTKDGIGVFVVCPLAWTAQLEKFKNEFPESKYIEEAEEYYRKALKIVNE